ncbi:MAG: hypothetical protein SP1CHLAM54_06070 [Chlamydiia bacterium]|nr:hypothetical protein [Chlamydiia bacterium]MCH9615517.1 hypothetical protein [Chlamydiia bacterium]MCH9629172.1 hypothetical protein [Chlamydiia bacterium]
MIASFFETAYGVSPELCSADSERFRYATCEKRHQNGEPYAAPQYYLVDGPSGDLYMGHEPLHTTIVCALMLVGNILDCVAMMAIDSVKTVWHAGRNICDNREGVIPGIGADLKEICLCAYYAIGLEIACSIGLIATCYDINLTMAMQTVISKLEFEWGHNEPRANDLRAFHRHRDFSRPMTWYTPYCMLKLGNLSDMTSEETPQRRFTVVRMADQGLWGNRVS